MSMRDRSRGASRFGSGLLGGDMGGRALGRGRKLASADLQLLILSLLEEMPRHGYEIIKALGQRTGGFYVPSPGMVYPALANLGRIGHAAVEVHGARKLHRISEAGRRHLDAHRDSVRELSARLDRVGLRMDQLRRAMHVADSDGGSMPEERRGGEDLELARAELAAALADKSGSAVEEQRRIVGILRDAAAEIRTPRN